VNYLAHAWTLPELTSELVLGAALPDLVRALDRRAPRLTNEAAARVEALGARELAQGIRAHQAADACFHALDAFREGCAELRTVLSRLEGVRGFFLAHLLLEILLDASLEESTPGLTARFYSSLASADLERAARACTAPGLVRFVERFRASRFLEDYATDEGVVFRLGQVLGRARQQLDARGEDVLRRELPGLRARVRAWAPALTAAPRAAVALALGT
jgi:hypothetical protein